MSIATIMLSFCEDSAAHKANPQYAPMLLLRAIGKVQLVKQRKQERKQAKSEERKGKDLSRNKELYSLKADSSSAVPNIARH